jgi:hypothetical protein
VTENSPKKRVGLLSGTRYETEMREAGWDDADIADTNLTGRRFERAAEEHIPPDWPALVLASLRQCKLPDDIPLDRMLRGLRELQLSFQRISQNPLTGRRDIQKAAGGVRIEATVDKVRRAANTLLQALTGTDKASAYVQYHARAIGAIMVTTRSNTSSPVIVEGDDLPDRLAPLLKELDARLSLPSSGSHFIDLDEEDEDDIPRTKAEHLTLLGDLLTLCQEDGFPALNTSASAKTTRFGAMMAQLIGVETTPAALGKNWREAGIAGAKIN